MTRQTWESLLRFLLAINDTILGPPLEAGITCGLKMGGRGRGKRRGGGEKKKHLDKIQTRSGIIFHL